MSKKESTVTKNESSENTTTMSVEKMNSLYKEGLKKFPIDVRGSVSGMIRFLDSQKVPRARISDLIGKRYQHVRNVLELPLKGQQS